MSWDCVACTYQNTKENDIKCEICETPRSNSGSYDESGRMIHSVNDRHVSSKNVFKRPREQKPTVQATLFGGIVTKVEKVAAIGKKPKSSRSIDKGVAQSIISFVGKGLPTAPNTGIEMWKYTAKDDIPFSELENRTRVAMKQVFGIEKLRLLQPKAVKCALKRKSQVVVMATGGGKSLCYQLPALVLGGTTIVISPLIALMVDQVKALNDKGVKSALISSSNGEKANREVMEQLLGRRLTAKTKEPLVGELQHYTLLYVTPEQVQTTRFREAIEELHKKNRLTLFAVDEAHCLSCWGHDFRKAYMRLGYLRENFPGVPLIACTATATTKVIDDIKRALHLESSPCYVGSFDRPNIFYKVLYKDVIDAEKIDGARGHLFRFIQSQHERCAADNVKCSGIVYCHTRAETEDLAKGIHKSTHIGTEAYHGGLKAHERNKVQHAWTSGESQIAVATVAFGMGIDLPHVRYVVHWNMAKSPEAFYQESGRAGRDGLPSYSILYYSKADVSKFQFLLSQRPSEGNKPNREMVGLDAMIRYCTKPGCRRCTLLKHFGETIEDPKAFCDSSCDYCVNPTKVETAIAAAIDIDQHSCYARESQPHLAEPFDMDDDNSSSDEYEGEWDGLGITKSTEIDNFTLTSNSLKPAANFEKASNILAKYEAVEMKSTSFVTFKAKSDKAGKLDNHFQIPVHLIPTKSVTIKLADKPDTSQRSSLDYASEAARLKDQIAKSKLELEARQKSQFKR